MKGTNKSGLIIITYQTSQDSAKLKFAVIRLFFASRSFSAFSVAIHAVKTIASKHFFPKKFGGVDKAANRPKSISNAVKKKRINFRLRKLIVPKAPLMVLNEMVGAVNYQFVDNPPMPMMNPAMQMQMYTAQCWVDGQTFTGTGPSKQIAKNMLFVGHF